MRKLILFAALFWPSLVFGQLARWDGITLSPSGLPVSVNVSVCNSPGLATTASQVTGNAAILTMASNPITAGFAANMSIVVSGFTGGDTYFNSGTLAPFTSTVTITAVSATTIIFPLSHANASASTNGSVFQLGTGSTPCAPLTSIFSDAAGTVSITQPGLTSSGTGNVGFFAAAGNYQVEYSGSTIGSTLQPLTLACPLNGVCALGSLNNILIVDGVQYPTCQAAITAAGSVNKVIILVPSTYAGAECPTSTNIDGLQNVVTTPNITIWDFRGGTVGHNLDFNSSAQDSANNISTQLSVMKYSNPIPSAKTASALLATHFVTGALPTSTAAALTAETWLTGPITCSGCGVVLGAELDATIGGVTGNPTIPVMMGFYGVAGINRTASVTVTNAYSGYARAPTNNGGVGSTFNNAYSFYADDPGAVATLNNYAIYSAGNLLFNTARGIDSKDANGLGKKLLRFSVETLPGIAYYSPVNGSGSNLGEPIYFINTSNTNTNWLMGCQVTVNNACEVTPSTGVGGTTFTTPIWTWTTNGAATTKQITSTLAIGTAPFSITSTTLVPNLNVQVLNGVTLTGTPSAGQVPTATSPTAAGWTTPAGLFTSVNVTPVTVSTNTTGDQNLMAITIAAGALNSVSRTLLIQLAGVYSTPAGSTAVLTHKLKLCTVSGCGSGTVITLATWTTTALGAIQVTNDPYNATLNATTQTAGASAAFEAHGNLTIDLSVLSTAAESVFADNNTATVGTIDSTAQLFLQHTVAFSAGSASNTDTDRQMIADTVD